MPGTLHLLSHLFPTTTLWGPGNGSQRAITWLLKHTSGDASLYLLVRLIGPALRNAVWKQFFRIYDLSSDLLTHPFAGDVRKGAKPEMKSRFLQKEKKPKRHAYIWFCSWFPVLLFTSWVILIKSFQLFNSSSIMTSYSQTRRTTILVEAFFFFFCNRNHIRRA